MKRKITVYTLLSSMMFSSLALTPIVHAESYSNKIEETQKEIQESEQNINRLNENIRGLESQQSATETELQNVNNYIASNEAQIQELVKQLEKSQKEHDQLLKDIKVLEENIAKRNEKLEEQARTVQVDGDPSNYLEFIIEAESLTDVMGRVDIVSNLVRANKQLVQEQKEDKEQVEAKRQRTEETINQQNATAAKLEEKAGALEQKRLEKEVLVAQLAADKSVAQSDKDAHLAQKAEAETRVAQYVSAQQEAEEAARAAAAQAQREQEQAQQVAAQRQAAAAAEAASEEPARETSRPAASQQSTPTVSAPAQSNNSPVASKPTVNKPAANKPAPSQPSTSKPTPPKKEEPKKPTPAPAPAPTGNVISYALSFTGKGISYVWGGSSPSGFDCSGFTSYVFSNTRGKSLARTAAAQYANSTKVSSPVPGDLVFFAASGSSVTHVGIYMGGGQFVGSQTSTGPAVASVNSGYWGPKLVGYGRY